MRASQAGRNWTTLAVRMGYTATPTQRAHILAATRRMTWSDCRSGDCCRVLVAPALRSVAAAVLASAAGERGQRPTAHPLHYMIRIGFAQLPGCQPLVGLDDGHIRQYVLDLVDEAISVLGEPSGLRASSHVA